MREFDFRGKNYDGQWKYGSLMTYEHFGSTVYEIITCPPPDFDSCQVRAESIGQFTGYVDSMNVRIYEGDVLHVFIHEYDQLGRFNGKTDMPPYLRGVVVYNERMCKFEILMEENTQCEDHHIISCEIGWGHEQFLVVGNFIEMPFKLERDRDYKKDIDKVMEQED